MSKVKVDIVEMAEKIQKSFELDKEGKGVVQGNPYIEQLPSGLTEEIVDSVRDYNTTFVAGTALAFGNAAVEKMSGDKKLKDAEVSFSMGGKDSITHSVRRERDVINPTNKETIVKYGSMTSVHEVRGSIQKIGQLGAVRAQIGELAIAKLSKG